MEWPELTPNAGSCQQCSGMWSNVLVIWILSDATQATCWLSSKATAKHGQTMPKWYAFEWNRGAYSVFWAERMMTRRRMDCSPSYAATGATPLIPLDIMEATYLQPLPLSVLSTMDLISWRAMALQKRPKQLEELQQRVHVSHLTAAIPFERKHFQTITNYMFEWGDLVLMHNTRIEKSLNKKMKPQYLRLLIVISRNKWGAYIPSELDGLVLQNPIAWFCVLPYFARNEFSYQKVLLTLGQTGWGRWRNRILKRLKKIYWIYLMRMSLKMTKFLPVPLASIHHVICWQLGRTSLSIPKHENKTSLTSFLTNVKFIFPIIHFSFKRKSHFVSTNFILFFP